MPALGMPNADSGALAHLVGFGPLDEKVHAFSSPADVLPGRVVPRITPPVLEGKFADPQETKEAEGKGSSEHPTVVSFQGGCLQPLQHVTQHLHSQRQSCGLEVDGLLEALDTPDGKSQHLGYWKRGSCTPWSGAGMRLLPHKPEWYWSSGSG